MAKKLAPAPSYRDAYRLRHSLPNPTPLIPVVFLAYPNRYAVSRARGEELRAGWRAQTEAFHDTAEPTELIGWTETFHPELCEDEAKA